MDVLPPEIFECVFEHLDVFNAHRFGMTNHLAAEYMKYELEKFRGNKTSLYDNWILELETRLRPSFIEASKKCAEYAEDLKEEFEKLDMQHHLFELLTSPSLDFFISCVIEDNIDIIEEDAFNSLERCDYCKLLNKRLYMTGMGDFNLCQTSCEYKFISQNY